MAYTKKTWTDRVSQYPNRFTMTNGSSNSTITLTRANGTVSAEGDAFNAESMNSLEERIESGITTAQSDATSALNKIKALSNAGTITTVSVVNALPASPNATTLYLVK